MSDYREVWGSNGWNCHGDPPECDKAADKRIAELEDKNAACESNWSNEVLDLTEEIERLRAVVGAAQFAQAVLWGSNGDKRGAIKYLDKALDELDKDRES